MRPTEEIEADILDAVNQCVIDSVSLLLKRNRKSAAHKMLMEQEGHWLDPNELSVVLDYWIKLAKPDCVVCAQKVLTLRGARQPKAGGLLCKRCASSLPEEVLRAKEDEMRCRSCKGFSVKEGTTDRSKYRSCSDCKHVWLLESLTHLLR